EAADDSGDRIPGHFHQLAGFVFHLGRLGNDGCHRCSLFVKSIVPEGVPQLPGADRSSFQLGARMPPLRLPVDGAAGNVAQTSDHPAVDGGPCRGYLAAGWFVHERHEFVREAGHGAADADAADVRAAANAVDPAPFWHIALHYRTPTAKLHN